VIWIEPIAGGIGRAGIAYERALGKGASLSLDVLGGYEGAGVTDLSFNSTFGYDTAFGLLGVGVHAFPLGEAPFGPFVGASVHAGFGGMSLEAQDGVGGTATHNETVFLGRGELVAGYSLALFKGLAVQGSIGLGGRYLRYLSGMAGEQLALGLTTWLGVGYAF
jgi:hypothetical protein